MNSRQSVHQIASKPDFPKPAFAFNHGKTPIYLENENQISKINHLWVLTPGARLLIQIITIFMGIKAALNICQGCKCALTSVYSIC